MEGYNMEMNKYSVADLFAGAGGLSLGFIKSGKFDIKVAFENSPDMQKTYKKNFPNVKLYGDVCKADFKEIQKEIGSIDVVIGGPPCQGFSNANRQRNHAISQNNKLVKQYVRAIVELQPKAFLMENVSMLKSDVHCFYVEKNESKMLDKYKIKVDDTSIHLIDEKFCYPELLDDIKDFDSIKDCLWSENLYERINSTYKICSNLKKAEDSLEKNKNKNLRIKIPEKCCKEGINRANTKAFAAITDYYSKKIDINTLKESLEPAIMLQRLLSKTKELKDNEIKIIGYNTSKGIDVNVEKYSVADYIISVLGSEENGYSINSDIICAANYGAPQKRQRFVLMGIKKKISDLINVPRNSFSENEYRTVYDAIGDLEDVNPVYELEEDTGIPLEDVKVNGLAKELRDSNILFNHIITKTKSVSMERFKAIKQGENFHALSDELKSTYTDASRTQNTVYLRLEYDEPSGTVVNVRKSMWIHPVKNRAISVREAARLQTFPDSFIFCGSKDKQYQQVGNAVPPIMAKALAEEIYKTLLLEE